MMVRVPRPRLVYVFLTVAVAQPGFCSNSGRCVPAPAVPAGRPLHPTDAASFPPQRSSSSCPYQPSTRPSSRTRASIAWCVRPRLVSSCVPDLLLTPPVFCIGPACLQEDSVYLWKAVCSNKLLAHVELILFMNKCDILDAKLRSGIRLAKYLRSFGDRPNDLENAQKCECFATVRGRGVGRVLMPSSLASLPRQVQLYTSRTFAATAEVSWLLHVGDGTWAIFAVASLSPDALSGHLDNERHPRWWYVLSLACGGLPLTPRSARYGDARTPPQSKTPPMTAHIARRPPPTPTPTPTSRHDPRPPFPSPSHQHRSRPSSPRTPHRIPSPRTPACPLCSDCVVSLLCLALLYMLDS